MNNSCLRVVAMAEECRALLGESTSIATELPRALHPMHLLWMSDQITNHAESWPATKLHRWIGFVQCGMLANHILDFDEVKTMFDKSKNAYGANGEDNDLLDHLNPGTDFKLEIGGEG